MSRSVLFVIFGLFTLILPSLVSPVVAQEASTSPRAAKVQSDLRQILSAPEYRYGEEGESVLDKIGKWLRERWEAFTTWWNELFSFGGRVGSGTSSFIMWIVLAGLVLLIAWVLAYALRRYAGSGARAALRSGVSVAHEAVEEQIDNPDKLLATAKELAASGQYRRAYRAMFLALLLRMDRLGMIRFDRSRTNGEYLRELRSRPEVLMWMQPLTKDFDLRWYGEASVEEPDYRRVTSAYDRVSSGGQSTP